MKKNFYLLAMLLVGTLTMFSACGDDDPVDNGGGSTEDVKTVTLDATAYDKWVYFNFSDGKSEAHEIEPVAGTYSGEVSVDVVGMGNMGTVEDMKLEVTRLKSDSVGLVLKDFKFAKYDMGDVAAGATITADVVGWDLAGSTIVVNNMNVSPEGNINGDSINMVMTIQPAGMPMAFIATYKGKIETRTGFDEKSIKWDIALHRYDVKTNGASAVATTEKDITKVTEIPASGYVADITNDSIMVDNSGMMNSKIGYAISDYNEVLSKGIEFDSKTMPPTPSNWTMSDLVYVVKLASGEYAKIIFTDYRNDDNATGHITFDYVYPFK